MMTGNTAIHIASQLQSGAPRKAAFLVAVLPGGSGSLCGSRCFGSPLPLPWEEFVQAALRD